MQSKADNSHEPQSKEAVVAPPALKPVADKPADPQVRTSTVAATLGNVLEAAEELWPQSLAEDWDAVGLVTGRTG
ncbi:MAG: Nif3-like dinuclear metal center hexameric protein, partial [Glutamicibacter protophormiae]